MKKILISLLIFILFIAFTASIVEYKRITNLRVKGWLFGQSTWTQVVTWTYSATTDTVAWAGVDTTCIVQLTPLDSTYDAPLTAKVSRNADTIFVMSDSTVFTGNKYSVTIIRP